MERSFGDSAGRQDQQSPGAATQLTPQRYRFSQEEMRVLQECNRESFWYRSFPLSTALGTAVYLGVKTGRIPGNAKWGATPKIIGVTILGYFIGKLSYQPKCMQKLMNLPDSQLAEYLKRQKGRGMGIQESLSLEPEFYTASIPSDSTAEASQDARSDISDTLPLNAFDNESSQHYSAIDIGRAVDATEQMLNDDNLPPARPQYDTTYDDLRRQNRIDFESYRSRGSSGPEPPRRPSPPPPAASGPAESFGVAKRKNQYGDVWEEVK